MTSTVPAEYIAIATREYECSNDLRYWYPVNPYLSKILVKEYAIWLWRITEICNIFDSDIFDYLDLE
jgi:hypothetical protein